MSAARRRFPCRAFGRAGGRDGRTPWHEAPRPMTRPDAIAHRNPEPPRSGRRRTARVARWCRVRKWSSLTLLRIVAFREHGASPTGNRAGTHITMRFGPSPSASRPSSVIWLPIPGSMHHRGGQARGNRGPASGAPSARPHHARSLSRTAGRAKRMPSPAKRSAHERRRSLPALPPVP